LGTLAIFSHALPQSYATLAREVSVSSEPDKTDKGAFAIGDGTQRLCSFFGLYPVFSKAECLSGARGR